MTIIKRPVSGKHALSKGGVEAQHSYRLISRVKLRPGREYIVRAYIVNFYKKTSKERLK